MSPQSTKPNGSVDTRNANSIDSKKPKLYLKWKFWAIILSCLVVAVGASWLYFGPYAKAGDQIIWKQTFKKALPKYKHYFELAEDKEALKDPAKETLRILSADILLAQEAKKNKIQPNAAYIESYFKASGENKVGVKNKKLYDNSPEILKKEITRDNLKEQLSSKVLKRRKGIYLTITYPYASNIPKDQTAIFKVAAKKQADSLQFEIDKNGFDKTVKDISRFSDNKNFIEANAAPIEFVPQNGIQDTDLNKLIFSTKVGNFSKFLEVPNGFVMVKIDSASEGVYGTWENYFEANVRKI